MKAIHVHQFGGPEVMRLETVPDPVPGASQIVVHVRAVGVNPVDTYIRAGTYARKPALPYIPGTDAAGIVDRVSGNETTIRPGDRVYIAGTVTPVSGASAEIACCYPNQVHPLPESLSFKQGAAIGVPYATAYRALFHRAGAQPGESVLVHGATGGTGLAAVQLARAHGLTVFGTGGTAEGIALAAQEGAHHVLNHREAGYLDQLLTLTGGRGVDVILEMAAHVNLDRDLTVLAPKGRVVVIGNRGRVEIDARGAMSRDAAILGMTLFNATDGELAGIHAALGAGFANGSLKPVVGREFPLADAAKAHMAVMEPGARGKIVLVP